MPQRHLETPENKYTLSHSLNRDGLLSSPRCIWRKAELAASVSHPTFTEPHRAHPELFFADAVVGPNFDSTLNAPKLLRLSTQCQLAVKHNLLTSTHSPIAPQGQTIAAMAAHPPEAQMPFIRNLASSGTQHLATVNHH